MITFIIREAATRNGFCLPRREGKYYFPVSRWIRVFLIRFFDSFFEEEEEEDAVEKTERRVGFKWISFGMMRVGRSLEKKYSILFVVSLYLTAI